MEEIISFAYISRENALDDGGSLAGEDRNRNKELRNQGFNCKNRAESGLEEGQGYKPSKPVHGDVLPTAWSHALSLP